MSKLPMILTRRSLCITLVLLSAPLLAAGQDRTVKPAPDVRVNHAAESLHARAVELFDKPPAAAAAAGLLVRAAKLRAEEDEAAVKELVTAAKLYSYAGRTTLARKTMQTAAARALSLGDVVSAAHSYIDAAFLAARQRDGAGLGAMLAKARLLASSPQLAVEDRNAILTRITPLLLAGQ